MKTPEEEFFKVVYDLDEVPEDAHKVILKALSELTEKEERVMRLHFGIDDGVEKSYQEIAKVFGVSSTRIRQIVSKSIKKLRHPARMKRALQPNATSVEPVKELKPDTPIEECGLSVRTATCLKNSGITQVSYIGELKFYDLYRVKNLGKKSMKEILDFMKEHLEILLKMGN